MRRIRETYVPNHTGWSGEMKKRQILRTFARTPAGFVFFKLQNLRERLFQARTMDLRAETASLVILSAARS